MGKNSAERERGSKIMLMLLILSVAVAGCSGKEDIRESTETKAMQAITSGSTGAGDVTIELKPRRMTEKTLIVDMTADTHAVDLSQFDLKQRTTLEFDGRVIAPSSAPQLSGHHFSGEIIFDIDRKIESFIIKIKGIPKVEERIFGWSST